MEEFKQSGLKNNHLLDTSQKSPDDSIQRQPGTFLLVQGCRRFFHFTLTARALSCFGRRRTLSFFGFAS
ncbi:hypothetical protein NLX71_11035 [Paenibacillus sp. MZ04-78.2]|nr:hypothetical protein [Paenibacillus sp. MZ04-78.2]